MKNKIKNIRGITLISLVITIIVLLILAGTSISALLGDNGLISKARQAKEKHIISMEKEQISISYLACINNNESKVTNDLLQTELINNGNDVDTSSEDTDNGYFIYVTFNNTQHQYKVDENGNILYLEDIEIDTSKIDAKLIEQSINYQDSTNAIMNPDRGLYRPVIVTLNANTFSTESSIQYECTQAKNDKIQILHLRIDIGQLSGNVNADSVDKNFTSAQISSLNTLFETIRENNLNAIVRFAYDTNGSIGNEPKSFSTVTNHIKQLSSFFTTNKDIISTVEAGFLGPWGEMHSASSYQADNYYKSLIETLLNNTPSEILINVRKPYFYNIVVGELNNSQKRLGIFNDGYLGSATDLGTFDNGITRNDFVNWMQTQGKYTLYGGEVTKFSTTDSGYNPDDEQYSESNFALTEMPKTHTSYLNSQFNTLILKNKWQNQTYTNSNSEYNGTTAYKYIADHLGYRFIVRNSKISSSVEKGEIAGVHLKIENAGFGDIVKTQKATVLLRKDNIYYETTLNVNAKNLNSGKTTDVNFYFYVPSDIASGDWNVYLKFANKNNSDYAIQFANSNMWDEDLSANNIGKITIEETIATENIKFKQAFKEGSSEGTQNTITGTVKKIPVTFAYYNQSNENAQLTTTQKNVALGTTINFKDVNSMSALGISIPDNYTFSYAQCYAITGNWDSYDSITIPNEPNESNYWINIFVKEKQDTKIPVTIAFYYNENQINSVSLDLKLGTTINFKDTGNLSNLGISIPSGHTFSYAQCYSITGDWDSHDSITIPSKPSESSYWINVFVN